MSRKLLAVLALLLWEGWWAYVYFSAPVPDEKMDTVLALMMGFGVPIWLTVVVGGTFWMVRWIKRSVRRD
jgi:hypothetical protein